MYPILLSNLYNLKDLHVIRKTYTGNAIFFLKAIFKRKVLFSRPKFVSFMSENNIVPNTSNNSNHHFAKKCFSIQLAENQTRTK
jgi:hypothetical protein